MINKKEQEEFDRISDILVKQGDIDVLTDMIPDVVKKRFINEWHEDDPNEERS